jgi:hypothetical protein
MPYSLRKRGDKWCVFVQRDGKEVVKGCSSSEEAGKKYLAVLNMREHGVPEKEKGGK